MSDFTSLLMEISDAIESSELETMKNSCHDYGISASRLEEIHDAHALFDELTKLNLLGPGKKEILVKLLEKGGRIDLRDKVLNTEAPSRGAPHVTAECDLGLVPGAPTVNAMLRYAHFNDISEDLGTNWRRLGRKLGISPNILNNIDVDYHGVKEKAFQTMSQWKKKNGSNATAQTLADALIAISRKDVAEKLAKLCRQDGIHVHISEENGGKFSQNNRTDSGGLDTMQADLEPQLPL